MKVRLEKEDKKYITLAQAPIIYEIIADMKKNENTVADWAKYAIAAPYNHREYSVEVLKASAKIVKNNSAWNALNVHSGDLDVWIDATAYVSCLDGYEFIIIGAYLSDIWQITYENALEIASHMFFVENTGRRAFAARPAKPIFAGGTSLTNPLGEAFMLKSQETILV